MTTIERALFELGETIEYPETPQFAAPRTRRHRPVWWAVAAAVVVLALVTTLVPAVRERVAAWLGIRGVTIERTAEVDPISLLPANADLGTATSLDDAPIDFGLLQAPGLGEAHGVFVDDEGRLTQVYLVDGELVLLTQFIGDLEPAIAKQVGVEVAIEAALVDGRPAVWIGEGRHVVFFLDVGGDWSEDRSWTAGPVLLWEEGKVTLRLEGIDDRDRAIAIAESVVGAGSP